MVQAIPDPRWRLCFQMIAAYGRRPEEIQPLELRQGHLWCADEKVAVIDDANAKARPREAWRLDQGQVVRS